MFSSVYDFKDFYNSPSGQVVKTLVSGHIRAWWPNLTGLRVVGIGYAQPYLTPFLNEAERCIAINPARRGACHWPREQKNLTVLAEESELPLETNSVDRVLLIHSLEYAELFHSNLQEVWRVLKSNGRVLIVTPNRMGLWARSDWSPYGQGTPYSIDQLRWLLRDCQFTFERSRSALYVPPLRWRLVQKAANGFERFLPYVMHGLGGLHIIEASKQLYAGTQVPVVSKMIVRGPVKLRQNPVPTSRKMV